MTFFDDVGWCDDPAHDAAAPQHEHPIHALTDALLTERDRMQEQRDVCIRELGEIAAALGVAPKYAEVMERIAEMKLALKDYEHITQELRFQRDALLPKQQMIENLRKQLADAETRIEELEEELSAATLGQSLHQGMHRSAEIDLADALSDLAAARARLAVLEPVYADLLRCVAEVSKIGADGNR